MLSTPESKARQEIDALLEAAGWVIQNQDEMYLLAGRAALEQFAEIADDLGIEG